MVLLLYVTFARKYETKSAFSTSRRKASELKPVKNLSNYLLIFSLFSIWKMFQVMLSLLNNFKRSSILFSQIQLKRFLFMFYCVCSLFKIADRASVQITPPVNLQFKKNSIFKILKNNVQNLRPTSIFIRFEFKYSYFFFQNLLLIFLGKASRSFYQKIRCLCVI